MVPRKACATPWSAWRRRARRILGVVLNRAQVEKHSYYYGRYYGHYYGDYSHRDKREREAGKVATIQ